MPQPTGAFVGQVRTPLSGSGVLLSTEECVMGSTWRLTVNGEKFRLDEADVPDLRASIAEAVTSGGAWVVVPTTVPREERVEVFMTPATQVLLRLTAPQGP